MAAEKAGTWQIHLPGHGRRRQVATPPLSDLQRGRFDVSTVPVPAVRCGRLFQRMAQREI